MEETKPWYKSQTLISLAGMILGVFLPRYAPVIPQLAGDVVTIVSAISTAHGRLRANKQVKL